MKIGGRGFTVMTLCSGDSALSEVISAVREKDPDGNVELVREPREVVAARAMNSWLESTRRSFVEPTALTTFTVKMSVARGGGVGEGMKCMLKGVHSWPYLPMLGSPSRSCVENDGSAIHSESSH